MSNWNRKGNKEQTAAYEVTIYALGTVSTRDARLGGTMAWGTMHTAG